MMKFATLAAALIAGIIPVEAQDRGKNDKPQFFPTILAGPLAPGAVNSGTGDLWYGAGNKNTGFMVVQSANVEVGLKIKFRQGKDIFPSGLDKDREINHRVPTGAQVVDPDRGVPVANAGRAAWSFDYGIFTGLDGSTKGLSAYDAELRIDTDVGPGYKPLILTMVTVPVSPGKSGFGWRDKQGVVRIADDGGTTQVTQNSQNVAFYPDIDGDPEATGKQPYTFGPGQIGVELILKDKKGRIVAHVATEVFIGP